MDEGEEDMPLFWLQAASTRHRPRGLHRQASSIFLNSGVFLIVLLAVAFTFVFVVVPPVGSLTSQIWRPQSIKKNWDSLNLVLVLFAIVCGFLSRNGGGGGNESTSYYQDQSLSNVQNPSNPSTPSQRWFEYRDRTMNYNTLSRLRSFSSYPDLRQESLERRRFYDDSHLNNYRFSTSNHHHHHNHHHPSTPSQRWFEHQERTTSYNSLNRLRSSSSYPDLRQESLERWRIYDDDDTHLNNYRFSTSNDQIPHHYPQPVEEPKRQEEDVGVKDIDVDTFVINQKEVSYPSSPPPFHPSPPSPLPPSPPPKLVRRKVKGTHQDLEYEKRTDQEEKVSENLYNIPPPPPPPPPIFSKNEKRRGKDFLTSLRRKKNKQRQKSVENLDRLFNPQPTPTSTLPLITPPPPPPLPPPPHFLQNLFSKKGKTKKLHPVPPPPPPPPVARVSKVVSRKVSSRTKVHVAPVTSHDKPPKPVNTSSFNSLEENVESGNASPLIPLPPPPPPPFKMRAWRFVRDGDYVRVGSFNSSRSGSPELDSIEDATSEKDQSSPMAAADGSDSAPTALFCPSPDVDTKADNFIARFKAGLQLEKVNSARGRSNLGPETSTR